MNKMFAVIRREYREVVRKKSFLVGTIATPLFMFMVIFLPSLLIQKESKNPIEFTLVDLGSGLLEDFKGAFVGHFEDGRPIFIVDYVSSTPEEIDSVKNTLNRRIDDDKLEW